MSTQDLRLYDIESAFFPGSDIQTPQDFICSKSMIKNILLQMRQLDTAMALIGPKGVGKTSLMNQICSLAKGNKQLAEKYDQLTYWPKSGYNYKVIRYDLSQPISKYGDFLDFLLKGTNVNNSLRLLSDLKRNIERAQIQDTTEQANISTALMVVRDENRISASTQNHSDDYAYKILEIKNALNIILDRNRRRNGPDRILIAIDNIEYLQDRKGLSILLDSCSNKHVKFVISGEAKDIGELLTDNQYLSTPLLPIAVNSINKSELYGILANAEKHLNHQIRFSTQVIKQIAEKSEGIPYFTHFMGLHMAKNAFQRQADVVEQEDFDKFFLSLKDRKIESIFAQAYYELMDISERRARILGSASKIAKKSFTLNMLRQAEKGYSKKILKHELDNLTHFTYQEKPVLIKKDEEHYEFTHAAFETQCRLLQTSA